jgi:3-oxoacyl-[acyl-carrier protein] reductase
MPTELLSDVFRAGPDIAGSDEILAAEKAFAAGVAGMKRAAQCVLALCTGDLPVTGKLVSASWDAWQGEWLQHLDELSQSDVYTLRRIAGRDRKMEWGDV